MPEFRRVIAGTLVALASSVFCLYILTRLGSGRAVVARLLSIHPLYLLISLSLVVVSWVLEALKMTVLIDALGERLRYRTSLKIALIGGFAAGITPFDTGGEPVQVYLLHREGIALGDCTAIVAVKGLSGALARLCLGIAIALWFVAARVSWSLPPTLNAVLTAGISVYAALLLMFWYFTARPEQINLLARRVGSSRLARQFVGRRKVINLVSSLEKTINDFRVGVNTFAREKRRHLALVALLSLATWLLVLFVPVLLLRGLGVSSPVAHVLLTALVFYLAAAYAPTPGSSGAAELGFAALFGRIVPLHLLGVFVLMWRLITYYSTMFLGGLLVAREVSMKGRRKEDSDKVQHP